MSMLYLIGGPTRTGKSLLAEKFFSAKPMPCMSIEWFRRSLFEASETIRLAATKDNGRHRTKALSRPISVLARSYEQFWPNALLEGDDLLPSDLARTCTKHEIDVRGVFLGYSKIDRETLLLHEQDAHHRWLHLFDDKEVDKLARGILRFSKRLERDCSAIGFEFIDMSRGSFDARQNQALDVLLKKRPMKLRV